MSISVRRIRNFYSDTLERMVEIDLYLPPGYRWRPWRRYPLVIFNDGQDLPRMHFSSILDSLYKAQAIQPFFAVGVHASDDRMRVYGTAGQPDYKGRGDRAGIYREFILLELLPWLQRHYRLSGQPEQTAIAGFSLGALSAFDIAWSAPEIFGSVGVFSGALWWRSKAVDPEDPDANRIMHERIASAEGPKEGQRYWFQTGTLDEEEDRNNNGVIDAIDDTRDLILALLEKGCPPDNIRSLEIEGGRHDPQTWGEVMPDFLQWLWKG